MERLIAFLIGYVCGNFLFAMIVGRVFLKRDPTKYGSGNPGSANVGAVFGKKWGTLTCIGDLAKSVLAILITFYLFHSRNLFPYTGLGLMFGHCFSVMGKFKGGKGVAVAAIAAVSYNFWAGVITLLVALVLTALMQNLTVPPLVFMLLFSLYVILSHHMEAGLIYLGCFLIMTFQFRHDLVDFFAGRGKRVDILYSIKKKLLRRN